jgi:hypothetical protein
MRLQKTRDLSRIERLLAACLKGIDANAIGMETDSI